MKQLFKHGDILYLINRVMPLHQFHDKTGIFNNEKMKVWKQWLGCDHVLKHNEAYLFVETIPEHEFEDLPHVEENQVELEPQTNKEVETKLIENETSI
jgi:hypothetical protein